MKATYYEPWATNDERLRLKPLLVSDADWRWLVQFWSSEEAQVRFNITFFLMIIHLLLVVGNFDLSMNIVFVYDLSTDFLMHFPFRISQIISFFCRPNGCKYSAHLIPMAAVRTKLQL